MKKRNTSVATVLALVLVLTTVSLGILAYSVYSSYKGRQWDQFRTAPDLAASQSAAGLVLPVWNFDRSQIERIVVGVMLDRAIKEIEVRANGEVRIWGRDESWNPVLVQRKDESAALTVRERIIRLGDKAIGSVRVASTPVFVEHHLQMAWSGLVAIIVSFTLIQFLAFHFAVRRIVLAPLKRLERYAMAVSAGNDDSRVRAWPDRWCGRELENLRASVEKMAESDRLRYAEMKESEAKYRALFNGTRDAILVCGFSPEEGGATFIEVNDSACRELGYTREQLLGMTPKDVGLRTGDRVAEAAKRQLVECGTATYEYDLTVRGGRRISVDVSSHCIELSGKPVVLSVARDVTERKRAEETIRQSERKLRAIFDLSFGFVGLLTPDGTLLDVNRTAMAFAGVRVDDVVGKPFWETPWWSHSAEVQDQLRAAIRAAAGGDAVRFETIHLAPDGSAHTIDVSLKPLKDESGRVILLIPEGRDITDRKKAEDALRESEAQFRSLVENLPMGLLIVSRGTVVFGNESARRMLGTIPGAFGPAEFPETAAEHGERQNEGKRAEQNDRHWRL